ncbi:MAG: hypothetical protein WC689_14070, partial [Methylocystis sp.]
MIAITVSIYFSSSSVCVQKTRLKAYFSYAYLRFNVRFVSLFACAFIAPAHEKICVATHSPTHFRIERRLAIETELLQIGCPLRGGLEAMHASAHHCILRRRPEKLRGRAAHGQKSTVMAESAVSQKKTPKRRRQTFNARQFCRDRLHFSRG